MPKKRPTAVTVIAVLNFVFAGLSIAASLCVTGIAALAYVGLSNAPAPKPGEPDLKSFINLIDQEVPSLKYYMVGSLALELVMKVILIAAGIGLLRLRPWGRTLCLVYAVVTILVTIASTAYTIAVSNPGMEQAQHRWIAEIQEKQRAAGQVVMQQPANNPFGGSVGGAVGSVIGAVIGITYSVVLLVIMSLPNVKRAFYPRRDDEEYDSYRREEPDDFDDRRSDDYDDRRRPGEY
jgi:hypothetical protein